MYKTPKYIIVDITITSMIFAFNKIITSPIIRLARTGFSKILKIGILYPCTFMMWNQNMKHVSSVSTVMKHAAIKPYFGNKSKFKTIFSNIAIKVVLTVSRCLFMEFIAVPKI
jgi:hypothetical protein